MGTTSGLRSLDLGGMGARQAGGRLWHTSTIPCKRVEVSTYDAWIKVITHVTRGEEVELESGSQHYPIAEARNAPIVTAVEIESIPPDCRFSALHVTYWCFEGGGPPRSSSPSASQALES